jgi:hypothetical protein
MSQPRKCKLAIAVEIAREIAQSSSAIVKKSESKCEAADCQWYKRITLESLAVVVRSPEELLSPIEEGDQK